MSLFEHSFNRHCYYLNFSTWSAILVILNIYVNFVHRLVKILCELLESEMCIKIPFREAMCPRDVLNETCICMKHAYV